MWVQFERSRVADCARPSDAAAGLPTADSRCGGEAPAQPPDLWLGLCPSSCWTCLKLPSSRRAWPPPLSANDMLHIKSAGPLLFFFNCHWSTYITLDRSRSSASLSSSALSGLDASFTGDLLNPSSTAIYNRRDENIPFLLRQVGIRVLNVYRDRAATNPFPWCSRLTS